MLIVTILAAAGVISSARAELVYHGVAAGMINVTQLSTNDDNTAGIALDLSINDFRTAGGNRADYNIQIGSNRSDDIANGFLMSCITQNGRNNFGTNAYSTTAVASNAAGYSIVSWRSTIEYNVNVAGAWFPYSQYIGGYVYQAGGTNNTPMIGIAGHPSLQFGVNYITNGSGKGIVDLHSFGYDSRTDGVLLVTGGKDENNFALAQANNTNGTWNIFCRDNSSGYESDPVGFVFIPRTNSMLISGRFWGNETIDMYSGDEPQFTVTQIAGGRWELKIPGHSPTNGILMISAEGGGPQNLDNIVSYQVTSAGDGWEIQSRDTPGNGLQTPNNGLDPICSFVYIPAASAGFTVTPTNNLLTTESAGTATFTVALHSQPKANVDIAVASDNSLEGTASPSPLTFTPSNWNVPQTVTVTGVDDGNNDGPVAYHVVLSPATSTDPAYNGQDPTDVAVINADNEIGVTVSAASISTTEAGGTATFNVVLNTQPAADVVVTLASSDLTEGTVSPTNLFFTTDTWNQPQPVTVTGVGDDFDDGNINYTIVTEALSSDANYNGVTVADVAAVNIDDDTAGVTVSPATVTVTEGGASTNFTLVLNSQPTANVTINLSTSDSSEGTVSPPSVTFTPADWFTPKNATLTPVNDFSDDGHISYDIVGNISSSDGLYASLSGTIGTAKTIDNEALLTLPSGTLTYSTGLGATTIDPAATLSDVDSTNFNGGSLTVTISTGATADDRLEVRNVGTGIGQIGVAGSTISYEGTTIGSASGGVGTSPLIVTLNSASTPTAAQALIRNLTFYNVNPNAALTTRSIGLSLNDGTGGTSSATKNVQFRVLRTFDFQEGADYGRGVYSGQCDTELNGIIPDTPCPSGSTATGLWVQWAGGIQTSISLLRFDNIFGDGPGQIPTNAIIVSADVVLNITDSGTGTPLHRMLQDWDATNATWNNMGGGIQLDDNQARSTYDSQLGTSDQSSGATTTGTIEVSVTPDVQAWMNGAANHGWVMPGWTFNGNATAFTPSESTNINLRPRLRVKWVPAGTQWVSFRQGVDGYTSARDTRINENATTLNSAANASLFVDADPGSRIEVLMRFDNIFGTATNQIPAGSTIHAAVLELASLMKDAMGDGGSFFCLLKPWEDTTSTWESWGGVGVLTNGVDALSVPTAVAGNLTRTPDVQGGYLNFELTPDLQAWANGTRANYGWAILPWPLGANGWGIGTAEATTERERPQLRVYFTPGSGAVAATMLSPIVTPSSVTVRFNGTIGSTYTVYRANTLTGTWTSLGTATVQGNGTATLNDNSPLAGTAFYRVSTP